MNFRVTMKEAAAVIDIKRLEPKICEDQVPPWVHDMYRSVYFGPCNSHADSRKNELDRFCINCLHSFCSNCLPNHALHKYVKIRRYVYCEVINRQDMCKLFNCSGIQAYHTNKTKVLFLKQRTQQQQQNQQQSTRMDHNCIICNRSLQDPSLYCSIECKVSALFGAEHKEEAILALNDSSNEKDDILENGVHIDEEYLTVVSPKRQKLRKGIALRAPMF